MKRCRGCGQPKTEQPCPHCGAYYYATEKDVAFQAHYADCDECRDPSPCFCPEGSRLHQAAGGGLMQRAPA